MNRLVDVFVEPLSHLSSDLTDIAARISLVTDQWAMERDSLMKEIANLRANSDRRELSTEIAQTETALIELCNRMERMAEDPTVSVSRLLRATAREAELQAYLKGLRFKAGISTEDLADATEVTQADDVVLLETATA